MKNFFLAIALLFSAKMLVAQAPQQINYQASIRDNQKQVLIKKDVFLKFTIRQNNIEVSQEIDKVTTSEFGIANTVVGDNSNSGDFTKINWLAGPLTFETAFSLDSTVFEPVGGAQAFSSVPFALAAETAAKLANPVSVNDLSPALIAGLWKMDSVGHIFRDTLNVGIGTSHPISKLTVADSSTNSALFANNQGLGAGIEASSSGTGIKSFGEEKGGVFFGNQTGIEVNSFGTAIHAAGTDTGIFAYSSNGAAIHANGPTAGLFEGSTYFDGYARAFGELEVDGKAWFNGELDVDLNADFAQNVHISNDLDVDSDVFVSDKLVLEGSSDYSLESSGGIMTVRRNGSVFEEHSEGNILINNQLFPSVRAIYPGDDGNTFLGLSNHRWKAVSALDFIETSDERLKGNIEKIPYGLADVMRMNPVRYNWKNEPRGKRMTGFLAQEMEQIVPEAVMSPAEAPMSEQDQRPPEYGMNYTKLIPVTVRAIQEQQAQIETLQKQLADALTRLEKLEKN